MITLRERLKHAEWLTLLAQLYIGLYFLLRGFRALERGDHPATGWWYFAVLAVLALAKYGYRGRPASAWPVALSLLAVAASFALVQWISSTPAVISGYLVLLTPPLLVLVKRDAAAPRQ